MKTKICRILAGSALVFSLAGCGHSNSGSSANSTDGILVTPSDIKMNLYPNVKGQILGSWTLPTIYVRDSNTNRRLEISLRLYVGQTQSAVRMTCREHDQVTGDVAGVLASTVDAANINLQQNLLLTSNDPLCNRQFTAGAIAYYLQDHDADQVLVVYQNQNYLMARNSDSNIAEHGDGDANSRGHGPREPRPVRPGDDHNDRPEEQPSRATGL